MAAHGAGNLPFSFDRGVRRIAATHMTEIRSSSDLVRIAKAISMSKRWALVLPEHDILEVMLHEIAHVHSVNAKRPRGPEFRAAILRLGGIASGRCYRPSVNIDGSPREEC